MPNADDAHPPVSAKSSTAAVTAAPKKGERPAGAAGAAVGGVAAEEKPSTNKMRRRIIWTCIWGYLAANFLMFLRFFFPRTLFEPTTVFRIGFPSDFALGVNEKFKQQARIWVIREADRIFVIYARCVHLGCTPDWKPGESKFKCPCHGSGYTPEGINFEGPAPRPMDRAHVELDAEGQIVVDTSKLYTWDRSHGGRDQFDDPGAYISLG